MKFKIPRRQCAKYYPDIVEKIFSSLYKAKNNSKRGKNNNHHKKMEAKHHRALEEIRLNPSLIGIEEIVQIPEIEIPFHTKDENGEVDAIIFSKRIAYLIEYKCNDCPSNQLYAKKQLKKAERYINGIFKKDITKLLYVHGDFKTQELRNNEFFPFNYTSNE